MGLEHICCGFICGTDRTLFYGFVLWLYVDENLMAVLENSQGVGIIYDIVS